MEQFSEQSRGHVLADLQTENWVGIKARLKMKMKMKMKMNSSGRESVTLVEDAEGRFPDRL